MQKPKLMPMEHGLFSRLPADLWYPILRHVSQDDMLALAATRHAYAEAFRNPQVLTLCFDPYALCTDAAHANCWLRTLLCAYTLATVCKRRCCGSVCTHHVMTNRIVVNAGQRLIGICNLRQVLMWRVLRAGSAVDHTWVQEHKFDWQRLVKYVEQRCTGGSMSPHIQVLNQRVDAQLFS